MGFAFWTMRPLISLKVPNYAKLFLDETHLESILNHSEPSGVLYKYLFYKQLKTQCQKNNIYLYRLWEDILEIKNCVLIT